MPPPKRPFLTFGLPFLTFMVVGHQGLTYIGKGRYEVKDEYQRQKELLALENRVALPKESIITPPTVGKDYEIVRVPRPRERDE